MDGTQTEFSIMVPGKPQQKGSKTGFIVKKKDGTQRAIVNESNKHAKGYQQLVRMYAAKEFDGDPIQGPVHVMLRFQYSRPKNHFYTGKRADTLRDDAPEWKTSTPDVDKLTRTVLDALSGVVFRDDAQVCSLDAIKTYRPGKEGDRTFIAVIEMTQLRDDNDGLDAYDDVPDEVEDTNRSV